MHDSSYVSLSIQCVVIWHRVGIAQLKTTRFKIVDALKVWYLNCFTVVQLRPSTIFSYQGWTAAWLWQDHLMNVWSKVTFFQNYNSHLWGSWLLPAGFTTTSWEVSAFLLLTSSVISISTLVASGGQGCFLLCFDSSFLVPSVPDVLPLVPLVVAIRVLGEPSLNWRLTRSSTITLAHRTVWMGTDIMELVGMSAVICCMVWCDCSPFFLF